MGLGDETRASQKSLVPAVKRSFSCLRLLPSENSIHALNSAIDDDDFLVLPNLVGSKTPQLDQRRLFSGGTPGGPNSDGFTGFVADTTFAVGRGYFTEAFEETAQKEIFPGESDQGAVTRGGGIDLWGRAGDVVLEICAEGFEVEERHDPSPGARQRLDRLADLGRLAPAHAERADVQDHRGKAFVPACLLEL